VSTGCGHALLSLDRGPRVGRPAARGSALRGRRQLLTSSDELVRDLDEAQVDAALAGHPPHRGEHLVGAVVSRAARHVIGLTTRSGLRWPAATRPTKRGSGRIYLVAAAGAQRGGAARAARLAARQRPRDRAGRRTPRARPDHPAQADRLLRTCRGGGRMTVSTHVVDAGQGTPAAGLRAMRLERLEGGRNDPVRTGRRLRRAGRRADGGPRAGCRDPTGCASRTGEWFARTETPPLPVRRDPPSRSSTQTATTTCAVLSPFASRLYRGS
jgi:hypothetical protein